MFKKSIALSPNTISFARISVVSKSMGNGDKKTAVAFNRLLINDCSSTYFMADVRNKRMLQKVKSLSRAISKVLNEINKLSAVAQENKKLSITRRFRFIHDGIFNTYLVLDVEANDTDYENNVNILVSIVEDISSKKMPKVKSRTFAELHTEGIAQGSFKSHVKHMTSKLNRMQKVLVEYQSYLENNI